MAGFTHTIGTTYKTAALTVASTTRTYTSDDEVNTSVAVAASTTNHEVDVVVDVSQIKSMVLYCDQAVTLKTNSTGSPADTIALAAKKEVIWAYDHLEACPLTTDVTKFFITNSNSAVANFVFSALLDLEP
jgi:hypothetical protein